MNLTEICAEIRNYFTKDEDKHFGNFTISGGELSPSDFLQEGQYFRIVGSIYNDGVYMHPAPDLQDETFHGAVWAMAVPPAVIALGSEIEEYQKQNPESPYTSESFSGYSYSKASNGKGVPFTWQDVFSKRLNKWRKIHE